MARGQDFEYTILRSLEYMVQRNPDLWGAGLRRRQAFGGQGFDVLFDSSATGTLLIECKTKDLTGGGRAPSSEKFYVEQAIPRAQLTQLLEMAVGMGATPLFAFEVKRGGNKREAWLVHAEDVARQLLVYNGITTANIAELGVELPEGRIEVGGKKKRIYHISLRRLQELVADYRQKVMEPWNSAVYAWAVEYRRDFHPLGVNLQRLTEKGAAWIPEKEALEV